MSTKGRDTYGARKIDPEDTYLTVTEAATKYRLHPKTIRKWIRCHVVYVGATPHHPDPGFGHDRHADTDSRRRVTLRELHRLVGTEWLGSREYGGQLHLHEAGSVSVLVVCRPV